MYLDNCITAQRFAMINKNCRDALEFLRVNPNYKLPLSQLEFPRNVFLQEQSFKQSIIMFPKLESIQFSDDTFKFVSLTPSFISHVIFNKIDVSQLPTSVPLHLITEVHACAWSKSFDFSTLPNIKRITLELHNSIKVSSFFSSKYKKFEFVRIKMSNFIDMDFVKSISSFNFHKIIFEFTDKQSLEKVVMVDNIFYKATICYQEWYFGINPNVVLLLNGQNQLTLHASSKFQPCFIDDYYPCSIKIKGINNSVMDLTLNTYIQSIESTNANVLIKVPTSLTTLQNYQINNTFYSCAKLEQLKISNYNSKQSIQLPTTITELALDNCNNLIQIEQMKHLNNMKLLHNNCMPQNDYLQLTRLEFIDCTLNYSIKKYKHVKEIRIVNCLLQTNINTFYPSSLKTLSCPSLMLPKKLHVSKLSVTEPGSICNLSKYKMLLNLTLYRLSTNDLSLPTSLKILQLYNTNSARVKLIQLQRYSNLHEVVMGFCCESLILPLYLHSFILYNSPCTILNAKDVTIQQLAVINSPFDVKCIVKNKHWLHVVKEQVVKEQVIKENVIQKHISNQVSV